MPLSEDLKNLLSREKYIELYKSGKKRADPFFYTIEKYGQNLFYFGGNHNHDPSNFYYPELKKFWEQFLSITNKDNSIVMNEGGLWKIRENDEEAIKAGGECSLITLWAHLAGYPIISPEFPSSELVNELLKFFSKDLIFYHRVARETMSYHKSFPRPTNYEEYYGRFNLHRFSLGWPDYDYSLEHAKTIHKDLFHTDFDPNDEEFFYKNVPSPYENSVLNEISRQETLIRDIYIVEQILKSWKEGKNIFIVFGGGHAVIMEEALRKILV